VSPSFSISGSRCQRNASSTPQKVGDAVAGFIGPQVIEFLAEHVGFEQAPIDGKEGAQFLSLRAADRLPPSEQQPALAATGTPHHGTRAKELLAPHVVERAEACWST